MSGKKTILIIGAKSDIAKAIAYKFASEGYNLQLACRNISLLDAIVKDLRIRYRVTISIHELDILEYEKFPKFVSGLDPLPDIVLSAVGVLGNQKNNELDIKSSSIVIKTNFEGPSLLLGEIANHFEKRKSGSIIGISSVAGERGRESNYIYGSSKSGFTQYLSGLRSRLYNSNISVLTILPGFVNTKMTKDLELNSKLTAEPDEVAVSIYRAYLKQKNIIFIKPIWMLIISIIKNIPEFIFKKLKF